jgi:hypothetical protein
VKREPGNGRHVRRTRQGRMWGRGTHEHS